MAKYKLIKKVNPQKRQESGKWYAIPKSETSFSGKAMTCAATANTTTAPIEMEASLEFLAKSVLQQLQQGHTVKIPGLDTFRLIFRSDGAEDINSFRVNSMIRNVRVVFTPSKELQESVPNDLVFKDGGVLEDDISYVPIVDYRSAKGISEGGGDSENPGEIQGSH